jgi:anti-sigma B factor antagonist
VTLVAPTTGLADGLSWVSLEGDLNLHCAQELLTELEREVGTGSGDLVVDLARVPAVDSTILGVLVVVQRRLQAVGRSLSVVAPRPGTRRAFEVTALDRTLGVFSSRAEALLDRSDGLRCKAADG